MPDETEALRGEIVESEKSRYDLLKWKLILVSGLGASGLGLGEVSVADEKVLRIDYLLCLIPLVCIYVDVLCGHIKLRIMVIGRYLHAHSAGYEIFAECARHMRSINEAKDNVNAFALEDWALRWSTIVLSLLVIVYASLAFSKDEDWWRVIMVSFPPGLALTLGIPWLFWLVWLRPLTVPVITLLILIPYFALYHGGPLNLSPPKDPQALAVFLTSGLLGLLLSAIMQVIYSERSKAIDQIAGNKECRKLRSEPDATHETSKPNPRDLIVPYDTARNIGEIRAFLQEHQTLHFPALDNGLFPASTSGTADAAMSGYHHMWVRDNVFIAYAHYVNGKVQDAAATAQTLARYFRKYQKRFDDIVQGYADPNIPMQRPHVRFDGTRLEEVRHKWAHAQNDALGYFLWFYARLACEKHLQPTPADMELLARFVQYLHAIRFWEDEDSGHWEETRKIGASSIGIVVSGLQAIKKLYAEKDLDVRSVDELLALGQEALDNILPNECIQDDPRKRRAYDAALLFLIYPARVVGDSMADRIVANVITHLQGDYGVRRYLNDSYWCAGFKKYLKREERTADFSDNMASRDALLRQGEEAQWCIFDPIISAIYGERFQRTRKADDLNRQITYLNRSLHQLTDKDSEFGEYKCPEAYYMENGRYVPNDHTPLLWTQANLWVALKLMEDSLS